MAEDNLPDDELIEEEEVETEESTEVEEDDSDIPEQWRGLDKKGWSKVLRDKDSFIGKLQDEARRRDADASRNAGRLETLEDQLVKLSSKPDTQEEDVKFDYDKPMDSINALVDKRLERREKHSAEQSRKTLFDKCQRAHVDGFTAAIAANPKLFEGIEDEVSGKVFEAMNPWISQGRDLSDDLRKQETFTKVAKYVRVDRGEYDYLQGNTIEPVPTDPTLRPQSGGSAGTRKNPKSYLTPRVREMMKGLHISEKEAIAMAKEAQDEGKETR